MSNGAANTPKIVSAVKAGRGSFNPENPSLLGYNAINSNAAWQCDELVVGGYDDWYLPAIGELEQLYNAKDAIGGFDETWQGSYWSSTETTKDEAWFIRFGTGHKDGIWNAEDQYSKPYKNQFIRFRCVRRAN